jgi:hypothetical protein
VIVVDSRLIIVPSNQKIVWKANQSSSTFLALASR